MQLPFFLAKHQFMYVFLLGYFACNILMILFEIFPGRLDRGHLQVRMRIPYIKLFYYTVCVAVMCAVSLLFDLRFAANAHDLFFGIFFAVLLTSFLLMMIAIAFWWPEKIGFAGNVYAQYASLIALSIMMSFVNSSHIVQKTQILREVIFIFPLLSMCISLGFSYWIWKAFKIR